MDLTVLFLLTYSKKLLFYMRADCISINFQILDFSFINFKTKFSNIHKINVKFHSLT